MNCPLCHEVAGTDLFKTEDFNYTLKKCLRCSIIYTFPIPTDDDLKNHYHASCYHKKSFLDKRFNQERVLFVKKFLNKGRVLDIGCGKGEFLREMSFLGYECVGLDPYCSNEFSQSSLTDQNFDIVTMWHSLEHMHNPMASLKEAFDLMKSGSFLILEVPHFESFEACLLQKHWFAIDAPRHLFHFTPHTLSNMVEASGFKIKKLICSGWETPYMRLAFILSTAKSFKKLGHSTFISFLYALKTRLCSASLPTIRLVACKG